MTSSDDLLRSLGRLAGEAAKEDEADARWEALARGELGAEDVAALEALASADPTAREKLTAYRPLDDAARGRIAAGITPAKTAKTAPRALRFRTTARVVTALAIAAGVALWIARSMPHGAPVATLDVAALPAYSMATSAGDRATRGGEATTTETTTTAADSRLEIRLRPAALVQGAVAVKGFLVQGAVVRPWSPPVQVSADGAIAITGAAGPLLGVPAGAWDVALAVGRPSDLPASGDEVARAMATPGDGGRRWQLFVHRVRLVDAP